jgi:hypothetical protein
MLRRRTRRARWSFGPFEFPPPLPPGAAETAGQAAHRKANVRYAGRLIFDLLFQLMGSHLGKFEAARLLLEWATVLAKHYPARGRSTDTTTDDFLLAVVAGFGGSTTRAAQFILKQHGNVAGDTERAVIRTLERLLRDQRMKLGDIAGDK